MSKSNVVIGDRFNVVGVGNTAQWPVEGAAGTYRVADTAPTPRGIDRVLTLVRVGGNHLCSQVRLHVVESLLWQFEAAKVVTPLVSAPITLRSAKARSVVAQ